MEICGWVGGRSILVTLGMYPYVHACVEIYQLNACFRSLSLFFVFVVGWGWGCGWGCGWGSMYDVGKEVGRLGSR